MFRLLKASAEPLTLQLAQEFRDLEASPTERDLDPRRLRHLQLKHEAGQLVTFHWAKAEYQGRWVRVNGQHSATMLAGLNGGFPEGLQVHVDAYHVESAQDLAVLFRQFDDRKSGRSTKDVAGAYQKLEDELQDLSKPVGKLGIEAVTWFRRYIEGVPTKVGDEQYQLFHESNLHRYLRWLNEILTIKTPELRRVPVVAAMHATFERNEEEARKFWLEVAHGGKEYEDNAPSTVLDEWLKKTKEERLELKPGDYFRGCIYAWNAYRDEKALTAIRHDPKKAGQGVSD